MTTICKHGQSATWGALFSGGSNHILAPPLFENAIASNLASPQSSMPPVILPAPPDSSLSPQSMLNLCSYIPSTVVQFLARQEFSVPARHKLTTAVLFADISGYSAMCELLGATHIEIEDLARIVKAYFGILVKVVRRHGGDVFKFAGDAVIVIWPETDDSLTVLARRCAQCALEIQRNLHGLSFQDSNGKYQFELSLKVGIGVGDVTIFHIGGFERRMEYLATGSPLSQAFLCESVAAPGTVVVSLQTAALIAPFFQTVFRRQPVSNEQIIGVDLLACKDPLAKRGIVSTVDTAADLIMWADNPVALYDILQRYVPVSVLPFLGELEERWASEIRKITVVFAHISLELDSDDQSSHNLTLLQKVMETIQQSVYSNGGSVNKFLFDDKGMSVLAVFGLLPLAHPNDSLRGVLGAKSICMNLTELNVLANCGVTTGYAFCGVTGGNTRREFSVLGDVVNISARLMQFAMKSKLSLVVDNATRYATRSLLSYRALEPIMIKGKSNLTRLFVPLNEFFPSNSAVLSFSTDLNEPHRNLASLSSIFTNERDVLRSKLRHSTISTRGLEQMTVQALSEPTESHQSFSNVPVYAYPIKSAVKALELLLDDGLKVTLNCCNIMTVGEAKLEAYRLGIIPHLEYAMTTVASFIPLEDSLRLDLIPVLAYDMELPLNGILQVKLVADIIDDDDTTLNLGRHSVRLQITQAVSAFMKSGEMQCIFLEGELGCGKTHTLASSICDAPLTVVCGRGSQLPSNRDLFVWKQVLLSVVDSLLKWQPNDDCQAEDDRRRLFIATLLRSSHTASEIAKITSFILNDERELSQEASAFIMTCPTQIVDLIVRFVVDVARYEPLVILIDNAQFLNTGSSTVLKALLDSKTKGVFVGLAIRSNTSLAITWMVSSMNTILASCPATRIRLRRLPDEFMRKLVATILDIQEIPEKILMPILNKSEGNPMICRELVYSIQRLGYIRISKEFSTGKSDILISEEFITAPVFPVPFTLQNTLGELVDSLSHCQRMILKVASILGQTFSYETIAAGYPIDEHQPILFKELQGLLQRNVLRPVLKNAGQEKRHSLPNFRRAVSSRFLTFSTMFLMDFVRSRILSRQVKYIAARITQMHFGNKERLVLYSGPMSVCKESGRHRRFLGISRWRSMWVEADALKINIFKKAGELIGNEQTGAIIPWIQIELVHAELKTSLPKDKFPYVIYINCNSWQDRRGQIRPGPFGLFLATTVEQDIKQWLAYLTLTSRLKLEDVSRPQLIRAQTAFSTGAGGSSDSDTDVQGNSPLYTLRKLPAQPRATTAIPDSSHLRILWNTFRPQIQRRLTK